MFLACKSFHIDPEGTPMSILLVNPPVNRLCEVEVNYYPLGIGYLAAIARARGHAVRLYNSDLAREPVTPMNNEVRLSNHDLFVRALGNEDHHVWREFRDVLRQDKPEIVGFSATSASIMPCLKMARIAKEECGAVTVFGGMHPTILPEDTAADDAVDYIVAGEAEESFPALVEAIGNRGMARNIAGVGGHDSEGYFYSPPGPLEKNLDIYPFPDRDSLHYLDSHKKHLQAIVTSRGCPFKCTFCAGRNMHKGLVRYRSAENVVDEIEMLQQRYDMHHIYFYDDALALKKSKITALCEEIIRRKLNIRWSGFMRVDGVDGELLKLMKAGGCRTLGMGVESGSTRVLARVRKGYTREDALAGVRAVKQAGIDVDINIIVGFPFETETDLRETLDLIRELQVPTNINTLTPYPGSELWDECVELGLIKGKMDWTRISQHSRYNDFTLEMSKETYTEILDEMVAVADAIRNKRGLVHYLNRIGHIWYDEGRDPKRFCQYMAGKVVEKISRNPAKESASH